MKKSINLVCSAVVALSASIALLGADAAADDLLAPGDFIIAIDTDPPVSGSGYPGAEAPANTIDGTLAKYLNFSGSNSGFIVTPAFGASQVQSFQITTANDAEGRDPMTWEMYGTNEAIVSGDNSWGTAESWTLLDSGAIALPPERDTLGTVVSVTNASAYTSYKMLFPTLKGDPLMQIAEAAFFETGDGSGGNVLAPGDPILAIDADVLPDSSYPGAEGPVNVIDGTLDKYLNFGTVNSGVIVTPQQASVVESFQITTANDAEERDPAQWEIWGTNEAIASLDNSRGDGEAWTLIDSGDLTLPMERDTLADPVAVSNSTAYQSYRILFPGLKDGGAANSMQIAELQLSGRFIPEPSSLLMATSSLLLAGFRLRRRTRS